MSNEIRQTELREKTQQLLQGPLKHIRAAALAAALLPLASVAAKVTTLTPGGNSAPEGSPDTRESVDHQSDQGPVTPADIGRGRNRIE